MTTVTLAEDFLNFKRFIPSGLSEDVCWLWSGATAGGRNSVYGIYARSRALARETGGKRMVYAHRYAYCIANNIDIDSLEAEFKAMHSCDTPLCCNPKHLSVGTQKDNMTDMVSRGRSRRGENATGAKLTELKVREIKLLLIAGDTHDYIAELYGVGRATISQIARGANWKWVTVDT